MLGSKLCRHSLVFSKGHPCQDTSPQRASAQSPRSGHSFSEAAASSGVCGCLCGFHFPGYILDSVTDPQFDVTSHPDILLYWDVFLKLLVKFSDSQGQTNRATWGLEPSLHRANPCSFPKARLIPVLTFSRCSAALSCLFTLLGMCVHTYSFYAEIRG